MCRGTQPSALRPRGSQREGVVEILVLGGPAVASFLDIAFMSSSDKIYHADGLHDPPAAGEWLRTPARRSEGADIDSRDGDARKAADSAGEISGLGSTQDR